MKKILTLIILLAAIVSIALIFMDKLSWATGLLTSTAWSIINFMLLTNIIKTALLKKSNRRLFATLLIKFPVLYLAGYLILASKLFPLSSLLAGLSALLILGVAIWPKQM